MPSVWDWLETEGWGEDWLVLLLVVLVCSALKIPTMHKFKKMTIVNFKLILLSKVQTNLQVISMEIKIFKPSWDCAPWDCNCLETELGLGLLLEMDGLALEIPKCN